MIQTDGDVGIGPVCCKKNYFYGGHSFKCKTINGMDADYARLEPEVRDITLEQLTK